MGLTTQGISYVIEGVMQLLLISFKFGKSSFGIMPSFVEHKQLSLNKQTMPCTLRD